MPRTSRLAIVSFVLVAVGLAPGVGVGREPAARSRQTATATVGVSIRDNFYKPARITINKGTKVQWVNRGLNSHTVTRTGAWGSGVLAPGASFSHVFRRSGMFGYHCTIHSGMKGTVIVR